MSNATTVVVFASQKGGSGKTTLSGHLAVEAQQQGDGPVALIDTDPQGSLAKWWNERSAEVPVFAQLELHELQDGIERLRSDGFRLIVIDTPPAVTSSIVEVVSHADLVVVPTRPSPHDLRAVGATVDLVEYQKKPLIFVVNSATARARITSETAVALSQHGMVAPVTIHHRVDFAASMIDGRTVGDVNPNSRSAKEISALWLYLSDRIQRLKGDPEVLFNGRKHSFDTEMLTPEPGSKKELPAEIAAAPEVATESDKRIQESVGARLSALAAESPVEIPAMPAAAPQPNRRVQEAVAARLSALLVDPPVVIERRKLDQELPLGGPASRVDESVNESWVGIERRQLDQGPSLGEPERRASEPWDGIERRSVDRGAPPGVPERRQSTVFGKRGSIPAPDISLKRYNA
ncbi:MAG TPA: ParA family protein [Xanthobacteraceae bacterium]|jgi:chromosome partitioning protein